MKKFSLRLIGFLLFTFIIYGLFIFIWPAIFPRFFQDNLPFKRTPTYLSKRLNDFNDSYVNQKLDIAIIGSSRAYRHYDPRIFEQNNLKIFNFGSSGQTFLQTEQLANKYIGKSNSEILIVDIYPGMFTNDGVEASLNLILNDPIPCSKFDLVLHHQNMKVFNIYLYNKISSFFGFSTVNYTEDHEDHYVGRGYVEKKISFSEVTNEILSSEFREDQINAFHNLLKFLKRRKLETYFIVSPMQSGVKFNSQNIEELIDNKSNKQFHFVNLSHINQLNDSLHFYDPLHLNQKGVEIFNEYLLKNHFK